MPSLFHQLGNLRELRHSSTAVLLALHAPLSSGSSLWKRRGRPDVQPWSGPIARLQTDPAWLFPPMALQVLMSCSSSSMGTPEQDLALWKLYQSQALSCQFHWVQSSATRLDLSCCSPTKCSSTLGLLPPLIWTSSPFKQVWVIHNHTEHFPCF